MSFDTFDWDGEAGEDWLAGRISDYDPHTDDPYAALLLREEKELIAP